MDPQQTQFQDGDLKKIQDGMVPAKLVQHDNPFEEMDVEDTNPLDALFADQGEQAEGEDEAPGEGVETLEDDVPGEGDAQLPDPQNPAVEDEVPGEGKEMTDEEAIKEVLDAIGISGEAEQAAQQNLETAISSGDTTQIQKAYDELMVTTAEKDRQIEILTKQVSNEKAQADKLLDEKFMAEADSKEKNKIYAAVMDDDTLKELVVYGMYADQSPEYKDRLKEAAKRFYEKVSGGSISDMQEKVRIAEKSGMGEGGYMSEGIGGELGKNNLIDGMFERVELS